MTYKNTLTPAEIIQEALSEYADSLREDDDPEAQEIADIADTIIINDDGTWSA